MKSNLVYQGIKVESYDENAQFEKGNRQLHKDVLEDILTFLKHSPESFADLGCGTGFFTDVFYKVFPQIKGFAIDGSEEMLAVAQQKFSESKADLTFIHSLFQDFHFDERFPAIDIVFSCLAIHHLSDEEKATLYQKIYNRLSPRGLFILFDLFKAEDQFQYEINEHIACRDIQRKLKKMMGVEELDVELEELGLENIIQNDRREKNREGDKESFLSYTLETLKNCGFSNVFPVNQENRFVSLIALK